MGQDLESSRKKVVGKPYEGKPHVRFEVAGVGDGSCLGMIPRQLSTLRAYPAREQANPLIIALPDGSARSR